MSLADELILNLTNAGGLIGQSFAQGQANAQNFQLGQQQIALGNAKAQALQAEQDRAQQYQAATAAYLRDPSPQRLSALMAQFPDQADALRKSFSTLDDAQQKGIKGVTYGIYSALKANRPALAVASIGQLINADRAAGHDVTDLEAVQADLGSSDPAVRTEAQKRLLAITQGHLAAVDDKFAESLYGAEKPYTLAPGEVRYGADNAVVASSPYKPQLITVTNPDGSTSTMEYTPGQGGGDQSADGRVMGWSPLGPENSLASVTNKVSGITQRAGVASPQTPLTRDQFLNLDMTYLEGTPAGRNNFGNMKNADGSFKSFPSPSAYNSAQKAWLARRWAEGARTVEDAVLGRKPGSAPQGSGQGKVVATSAPKPVVPTETRVVSGQIFVKINGQWMKRKS